MSVFLVALLLLLGSSRGATVFSVEDGVMSPGSADALRTKILRNTQTGEMKFIINQKNLV